MSSINDNRLKDSHPKRVVVSRKMIDTRRLDAYNFDLMGYVFLKMWNEIKDTPDVVFWEFRITAYQAEPK